MQLFSFLLGSSGEKRLLSFALDRHDAKSSIDAYESGEGRTFRAKKGLPEKIEDYAHASVKKIKTGFEKYSLLFGARDKGWIDSKLTKMAKEMYKTGGDQLRESDSSALQKIAKISRKWRGISSLLEHKKQLCDEVIGTLQTEIGILKARRAEYAAVDKILGDKMQKLDVPGLKSTEAIFEKVKQIRSETDKKINADKVTADVKKLDEQLKTWLVDADPSVEDQVEQLLHENVAGTSRRSQLRYASIDELIKQMYKDGKIHHSEKNLYMSMTKKLRKGKYNKAAAAYYRNEINKKGDLNPTDIVARIAKLKKGQRFSFTENDGTESRYSVVSIGGKKAVGGASIPNALIVRSSKNLGIIDPTSRIMWKRNEDGTYSNDIPLALINPPGNPNPSLVYLANGMPPPLPPTP